MLGPAPAGPSSSARPVVRPTLANLLSSSSSDHHHDPSPHRPYSSYQPPAEPEPEPEVPLTHPNPADPTVRTLGISSTLSRPPSPRKTPRKPPPGAEGVLSAEPFQMTRAHLAAYRVIQLRRPSPVVGVKGEEGKRRRRLCMAEAAWWFWAEKGGRWNGGKGGKRKKGDKDKDKGKEKEGEGEVEAVGEVDDVWGANVRACNAYSYDENGDPYRPTMSMLEILRLVLAASMDKMLSLPDIYKAVEARWPYYKTSQDTWKGSIRNNLSVHPCFQQVAREDEQGRPMKGWWRVVEEDLKPSHSTKAHREKRKHPVQPLLSTDLPPHPLHPSFARIDPDFGISVPGPPSKKRKIDGTPSGSGTQLQPSSSASVSAPAHHTLLQTSAQPQPQREVQKHPISGKRYKYQTVHIPGKTPNFPLPGIPPHPAGVVPAGYPNPLPAGWKYGWGDPTLVDLGRRYGPDVKAEGISWGRSTSGEGSWGEGGSRGDVGNLGLGGTGQEDRSTPGEADEITSIYSFPPYPTPEPSQRGSERGFAPLSEFSQFLSASLPLSSRSTCSTSPSSTSSRTSTASIPLHLPFLNLLSSSSDAPHPPPSLPASDYPLSTTSTSSSPSQAIGSASTHLQSRGAGFVPLESRGKWRARIREMEPFPGSGEWVHPRAARGGLGSGNEGDGKGGGVGGEWLPGIEVVLGGKVKRGDPRLTVVPPGKGHRRGV